MNSIPIQYNVKYTLNSSPWILPRSSHFIANFDKFSAADYSKRYMGVHRAVSFSHALIINWKLINVYAIVLQFLDNFRLEFLQLRFGNCVSFCDNRYDVDLGVQFLHTDEIDRFEPVSGGADKVQTHVDSGIVVRSQVSFNFQLFLQISFKLCVNVINDGLEGVLFVNLVTVADGIDDSQLQSKRAESERGSTKSL